MASFKYKNMQQFVKQTLYPYIVNLSLLIKDLFNRLANVESKLGGEVSDNLTHLQNQISSNDTDISNLQTQITANDSDIINLQSQISSNDDDITKLQTNVSQIYGVGYTSITSSTMLLTPNELATKIAAVYGVTADKLEATNYPTYTFNGSTKAATPINIADSLNTHASTYAVSATAAGKIGSNPHKVTYMSLEDWSYGTLPPDKMTGLGSGVKVYDQVLSSV